MSSRRYWLSVQVNAGLVLALVSHKLAVIIILMTYLLTVDRDIPICSGFNLLPALWIIWC
jgi:hypothetical protein